MTDVNSEVSITCADLQSKNLNANIHYQGKDYSSKIGFLLTTIIIFFIVNFFFIDLKTDIYGEAYARFIASDLVDAKYNIKNVFEVTKKRKRGGTTKSYTADIIYNVDGIEYNRSIPGISSISDVKKMNYKYSKGHPSLGYTEANTFSFYFDLVFLGASFAAIIIGLFLFLLRINFYKSRVKNNCVIENYAYGGIVKKDLNSDLSANYYMTNDGSHYFISAWSKDVVKEDVSSSNKKKILIYKNNTFTFVK